MNHKITLIGGYVFILEKSGDKDTSAFGICAQEIPLKNVAL